MHSLKYTDVQLFIYSQCVCLFKYSIVSLDSSTTLWLTCRSNCSLMFQKQKSKANKNNYNMKHQQSGLNSLLNLFLLFRTVCHLWLTLQCVKRKKRIEEGGRRK